MRAASATDRGLPTGPNLEEGLADSRARPAPWLVAICGTLLVSSCSIPPRIEPDEIERISELEGVEWAAWSTDEPDRLGRISRALADASSRVRLAAARMLGRRREASTLDALTDRLAVEEDAATRREIVRALALFALGPEPPTSLHALLREIASDVERPDEARAALRGLGGEEADRPILRAALESGDEERELAAALACAARPAGVTSALLARLDRGSGERVRWVAARALLNTLRASDPRRSRLEVAVDDPNLLVVHTALSFHGKDPARGLDAQLVIARGERAFGFVRAKAIRALGTRLERIAHEDPLRTRIEDALLEIARDTRDRSLEITRSIYSALGQARTPRAVAAIVGLLATIDERGGDDRNAIICGLLDGLNESSADEIRSLALSVGQSSSELGVRLVWASTCARLRADGLNSALADGDARVARAALETLDDPRRDEIERGLDPSSIELASLALERARTADFAVSSVVLEELLARGGASATRARLAALGWIASRATIEPWRDLAPQIAVCAADPGSPGVRRRARSLLDRLAFLGEVEPARPAPLPFPLVSVGARWDLRPPRALLLAEGPGEIVLELFSEEAPHHASALLESARRGEWKHGVVRRYPRALRLLPPPVDDTSPVDARTLGRELPEEPSLRRILPGTLFVGPIADGDALTLGELFVALEPLPELEGRATVVGRVRLHTRRLEELGDGSVFELGVP